MVAGFKLLTTTENFARMLWRQCLGRHQIEFSPICQYLDGVPSFPSTSPSKYRGSKQTA
jgi:hypothetical protein